MIKKIVAMKNSLIRPPVANIDNLVIVVSLSTPSPDLFLLDKQIVLAKFKSAIFVDGEFWRGYNWNEKKSKLKRNKEYWIEKIEENIERDKRVDQELKMMEWIPIHFWTKEIDKNLDECLTVIDEVIFEQSTGIEM